MSNFFGEIKLSTTKGFELIGITDRVNECIKKSRIKNGVVVVFSPHTTCAIKINEYEKSLMGDFQEFFERLAPQKGAYRHNKTNVDGRSNAHSHLQSMVLNSSETIPLRDGQMLLGSWQTIFFVEIDGPRPERKVLVEVIGE